MNYQDKLNMFIKKEEDKKDITSNPEIKKFNKERLAMFNQNNNSEKKEKNSNIKKDRKQIILEKSSVISDENPDKIIRKYPNLSSTPRNNKILL